MDLSNPNKTPFGEMTDSEQGGLLLAKRRGVTLQGDFGGMWLDIDPIYLVDSTAYRVRPEPKRETVTHEEFVGWTSVEGGVRIYHTVRGQKTTETVDGKPVRIVWEADQ